MTTTCPQCGKPIRPGAKFCGSCGATLAPSGGAVSPPTPPPSQAAAINPPTPPPSQAVAVSPPTPPPAQAGAVSPPTATSATCIHCGQPVRLDARFCPSCGKGLTPVASVSPATPPPGTAAPPPVVTPGQPAAAPGPGQPPPPAPAAGGKGPAGKSTAAKPARKGWILWLVLGIVALLIILGAVFVFWQDPFGFREEPTPTETEAEQAPEAIATTIETLTPTLTPPPVTPTLPISGTITSTVEASASITLTVTAPVTATIETPVEAAQSGLVFSDAFTGTLSTNWETWGPPTMVKSNSRLELTNQTAAKPSEAGVTSREDVNLGAGLRILFSAGLLAAAEQDVLLFDWDSKEVQRDSSTLSGPIHLAIGNGAVVIEVGESTFRTPLADIGAHTYEIRIAETASGQPLRVVVLIDGKEAASAPLQVSELEGAISYSGRGWVDDVQVFSP